jgi:hypothetical protein
MHPDFSRSIALFCPYCLQVSFLPPFPCPPPPDSDFDIKCGLCKRMMHLDSEFKLRVPHQES